LLRHGAGFLDLPIEVTVYDGSDSSPFLTPLHVDFRGPQDAPTAVVITVAQSKA
jgi:hypothetical protein